MLPACFVCLLPSLPSAVAVFTKVDHAMKGRAFPSADGPCSEGGLPLSEVSTDKSCHIPSNSWCHLVPCVTWI